MLLRRACSTPIFRRVFARAASSGVPPSPTARHGALLAAIRQIEAAHGKGSLMQLGQTAVSAVDVIPTGSLALDTALGIGGLPRGRIVEIYGAESSGKTTVALQVVAEAQRMGLTCFFCDAEHAIDPAYARALGINLDALYLSQPDTGEQALEIVDTMVRSGGVDVVVVDSVAALVPKAELEGEMGDSHMALQARLMSQALRKLTASLSKSHCLIIFINQIRSKVRARALPPSRRRPEKPGVTPPLPPLLTPPPTCFTPYPFLLRWALFSGPRTSPRAATRSSSTRRCALRSSARAR
jgi:RecA/RadA recombinase